jgi:hypothetical protein
LTLLPELMNKGTMGKSDLIIRPGLATDIVDQKRHLKSMIYDVIERRIIIAQTVPPLTKFNLKKRIVLTFLVKEDGHHVRYGVYAEVTDFIQNYELASADVMAVGLAQKTGIAPYDLRSDFRVRLPAGSGIDIQWNAHLLNIINISLGGAMFSYRGSDLPGIGGELKIALIIDEYFFKLSAMVLGVTTPIVHDPEMRFVRVKFVGSGREHKQPLMKKLLDIQRKLICEGKLP